MTFAKFKVSLNKSETLLKQIKLLRQKGFKSINENGVSDEFKKASQKQDYLKTYKTALKNYDFDFLLNDESFFQFEYKSNQELNGFPDIRYSFFQNPQEFKTYADYLEELGIIQKEQDIEEIGDVFQEEYEQFLIEQQVSLKSITIRFDTDALNYRPLIHSVAHIHIGYNNNVRIPCDKIITPEKFVLFVLKNTYYDLWKDLIENKNKALLDTLDLSKKECSNLELQNWIEEEKQELFIT